MKIPISVALLFTMAAFPITSCNIQKTTALPAPPNEQEIAYYRQRNPTKSPIVFGQVAVIHSNTETHPVSSAIISVDKRITLANKNGEYNLNLSSGIHSLVAGQIGFYKSSKILTLSNGDSIKLNFHLNYDSRPITN